MPNAVFKNAKTIKTLIKLVITKIKDGAKTNKVKTKTTFNVVTSCVGVVGAVSDRLTLGIVTTGSAENKKSDRDKSVKVNLAIKNRFSHFNRVF